MTRIENIEEIKSAVERLKNHAQYCLGSEDLYALNTLIELAEDTVFYYENDY